jgi:hypothetical protein
MYNLEFLRVECHYRYSILPGYLMHDEAARDVDGLPGHI